MLFLNFSGYARIRSFLFSLVLVLTTITAFAPSLFARDIVISNSGVEVEYSYATEFRSLTPVNQKGEVSAADLAQNHAEHIFGVFQSSEVASRNGFPAELTEGFAGTKHPHVTDAKFFVKRGDPNIWVKYSVRTKALLLNRVAENLFGTTDHATLEIPLIEDLSRVYSDDMTEYASNWLVRCTDSHYQLPEDFAYFHNPYRCPELGRAPIGKPITLSLQKVHYNGLDRKLVPLDKVRADNGNGKLVVLYFTFGFVDHAKTPREIKKDMGRINFDQLSEMLKSEYGFKEMTSTEDLRFALGRDFSKIDFQTPVVLDHPKQRRFFRTHVLKANGITWVVRSGLFPTDNIESERPLYSFPKFWKESWENGDFIYYGGHSEGGQSLYLDSLIANLNTNDIKDIRFKRSKSQIAFFDSCSSYAHFVDMYKERKPDKLSVVSYGLVSLFHLAQSTMQSTLRILIKGDAELKWKTALETIEQEHLKSHIDYFYKKSDYDSVLKYFTEQGLFPSYLLSVTTDI